jgi:hypothetical protein
MFSLSTMVGTFMTVELRKALLVSLTLLLTEVDGLSLMYIT